MNKKTVNVVFASDNNYVKYTAVTLASLLKNMDPGRPLSVFILSDEHISIERMEKINKLQRIHGFSLVNYVVDAGDFARVRTTPGISVATYYRLVMHDILPKEVKRVVYLDSDLIVRRCIGELFDIDLDGYVFAGVEDSRSKDYKNKFGTPDTPHINAGVTLIDLGAVRSMSFAERVEQYINRNKYTITLGDQQILNGAFANEIKYIPVEWNVHGSMFDRGWCRKTAGLVNDYSAEALIKAASDPAITHYTYKRKPWLSSEHPRAAEWSKYAAMTDFFTPDDLPRSAARKGNVSPARTSTPLVNRFNGYLLSIAQLRETRLRVNKLMKALENPSKQTAAGNANSFVAYHLLEDQSARLLSEIAGRPLSDTFSAREYVESIPEYSKLFTNGEPRDLDGGFHENIKILLKTPDLRRNLDVSEIDGCIIMVQRLRQENFWKSLYYAKNYDKDIIFAETTFFGAFGSYYEAAVPFHLRKSFGYILDDMGYYFDARIPSRLERTLNSSYAALTQEQAQRARRLIERIKSEGITKYNYSSTPKTMINLPPSSVLIIDQKQGDASIEFAGATTETFELMISAAIRENPNSTIFLKPHPDNMGKNSYLVDDRVKMLPQNVSLPALLDQCEKIYVVSSQVGFEGILRGKEVHVFGLPFYAGWGLTLDRQKIRRRTARRTAEELFHAACIQQSVYLHPINHNIVEIEEAFDLVAELKTGSFAPSAV